MTNAQVKKSIAEFRSSNNKIKKSILEFIKNRESVKSLNLYFFKSQNEKDLWFRFFATNAENDFGINDSNTHVFTVIKNDEAGRNNFACGFVDNSMTAAQKKEEKSKENIDKFIAEYFKQEFVIDGVSYLFRWS